MNLLLIQRQQKLFEPWFVGSRQLKVKNLASLPLVFVFHVEYLDALRILITSEQVNVPILESQRGSEFTRVLETAAHGAPLISFDIILFD